MKEIEFIIAKTKKDLQDAADLVQLEYEKSGYANALPDGEVAKISPYLMEKTSTTFLAKLDNIVLGTVTVVGDGKIGFPLDSIFSDEIEKFREKQNCAEISQLAIRRDAAKILDISPRMLQLLLLLPLFKLVYFCARARKIDCLCITVNPKHDSFYLSVGFKPVGAPKSYETVNGAPALLRIMDLRNINFENSLFREILNDPIEEKKFLESERQIIYSVKLPT